MADSTIKRNCVICDQEFDARYIPNGYVQQTCSAECASERSVRNFAEELGTTARRVHNHPYQDLGDRVRVFVLGEGDL